VTAKTLLKTPLILNQPNYFIILGRKTAFLATALFCNCIDYFQAKTNEPVQGPLEASDPALSKTIVWENSVVN